jgi:cell division ATPase FtsA
MSRAKEEKNLIIGLDIGTSKVVAIVAELMADGSMNVIGLGQHVSRGLKKGVVINIDSTVNAIQRAIEISRRWHRAGPESAGRAKLGDTFSLLHAEDF